MKHFDLFQTLTSAWPSHVKMAERVTICWARLNVTVLRVLPAPRVLEVRVVSLCIYTIYSNNLLGSFECYCPPGFTGPTCTGGNYEWDWWLSITVDDISVMYPPEIRVVPLYSLLIIWQLVNLNISSSDMKVSGKAMFLTVSRRSFNWF